MGSRFSPYSLLDDPDPTLLGVRIRTLTVIENRIRIWFLLMILDRIRNTADGSIRALYIAQSDPT